MQTVLQAIAEPRRREILVLLRDRELTVGEVAVHFTVTRPAISQHLGVLKSAGLVVARSEGTRRLYRARPEGLRELRAFLEAFWDDRLALLKQAAELEERNLPIVTDQDSTVIERHIRIAARPETVFAFFTDPLKMLQWIGKDATVEARPGGAFRIDMNGRDIVRGEFVEVMPYSRIVFTWGYESDLHAMPPGSSAVEVSLVPDGDGTIVRLRHSGLPKEAREAHETGWAHYLLRLRAVAEGKDPGPDPLAAPVA